MNSEKRQHIIETAMVLFNTHGFHATPTSKIAKKAKVSVGTLFNYFSTKEDLIEAIYIHIKLHSKTSFLKHMEEQDDAEDNVFAMWRAIIQWGTENPEEFNYLELFCHSPLKSVYQREQSLEAYKQFQEKIRRTIAPVTSCSHDPEFVLTYINNALHSTIRYLITVHPEDEDGFIINAFHLLWNGLTSEI